MFNSVSDEDWLRRIYDHISPNFYRAEPRMRAWTYLQSLLDASADGRSSRRHLATYPGERRGDGAQRLLTSAQWDEEQVKADVVGFIKNKFGPRGGTLHVTEMAFRKKGMHAAGVQRQFSVETGRYENSQLGILLFYEAADGSLLFIDRELYMPETWLDDPARCARAGMPQGLVYRSKSAIAAGLVNRAIAAGIRPDWVMVSLLCSDKYTAQQALQQAGLPHVLLLTGGEFHTAGRLAGPLVRTVSQESYAAVGAGGSGASLSAGTQWERRRTPVRLRRMTLTASPIPGFDVSYLVDSASGRGTAQAAGYYAFTPQELQSHNLAEVVAKLKHLDARCWQSRADIGIDRYEVRSWRGWYRHMTLAMAAYTAHAMSRRAAAGARAS